MRIHRAWHFYGDGHLPTTYQEKLNPGPYDLSMESLQELVKTYDVMIHTTREGEVVLALDVKGQRFHSR